MSDGPTPTTPPDDIEITDFSKDPVVNRLWMKTQVKLVEAMLADEQEGFRYEQ